MIRAMLIWLLLAVPSPLAAETLLLMAEEPGCFWCEQWNKEIGPIYPKTAEGKAAPLRAYDILQPPKNVSFARRVHYTPTFILVQDGNELARIEGYPGEDFFWGLLGQMLEKAQIKMEPTG